MLNERLKQLINSIKIIKMKQITKILILGILFLFISSLHLSAQKCKYVYNTIDPITSEVKKKNKVFINNYQGSAKPLGEIGFEKINEVYFLTSRNVIYGQLTKEVLPKNEPLTIKLSNGEIITVYSQDECIPVEQITSSIETSYSRKYNIDAATLRKIADNPPTYIRANLGSRIYEREISSGIGKKIAGAAACILQ